MIVLGAILLILGVVFGISHPDLHRCGASGHRRGLLDSGIRRPARWRQASLVLTPSAIRPAEVERGDRHRPQDGARPGVGRSSLDRLARCAASSSAGRRRRAPSAGRRPRSALRPACAARPPRSRRTGAATLRTCRLAGAGRWPRSRSWMRIRSDSPSAKSRWKSISPSSAVAGSGAPRDDGGRPGQQPGADADQQLDQQRLLVREVPVDRGPADPGGGADILQSHRQITRARRPAVRPRR